MPRNPPLHSSLRVLANGEWMSPCSLLCYTHLLFINGVYSCGRYHQQEKPLPSSSAYSSPSRCSRFSAFPCPLLWPLHIRNVRRCRSRTIPSSLHLAVSGSGRWFIFGPFARVLQHRFNTMLECHLYPTTGGLIRFITIRRPPLIVISCGGVVPNLSHLRIQIFYENRNGCLEMLPF